MKRLLLTALFTLIACDTSAFEGTVERVVDGDTFIMSGARVRLWGIDAPELRTAYGPHAKAALVRLVADDAKFSCEIKDNDRYKRIVARCRNKHGDIGAAMVAAGHAYDWSRYSSGAYAQQELQARQVGAGMWRGQ